MEEQENPMEAKERLEELAEYSGEWVRYLSISTALIAVLAAIASLLSGNYANTALVDKNNAILSQSKASDQWNYYQSKGIKKNIDEGFFAQSAAPALKAEIDKYTGQQADIQKMAQDFEAQAEQSNNHSETMLEKHHKAAISVTFFQIAIALSAMAALVRRRWLWHFSLTGAAAAAAYLLWALR